MSNHITEEIEVKGVIAPKAQSYGGNDTGAYLPLPKFGTIDFVVNHGALAEGKAVTVEVYQASDTSATGAAEITSYETSSTGATGGSASGQIIVKIDSCDVTKGFVTVKVSNDAASGSVPIDAFALIRKQYCK